jgi:hypothetical protein
MAFVDDRPLLDKAFVVRDDLDLIVHIAVGTLKMASSAGSA